MKGSFSEESLAQFAELVAQNQPTDFAEGGTYDFTRCVRADGTAYGTGGKCRKGSEAGAREKPAAGGGKKKTESEAPIAPVPPKPIKDPIPGVLAKAKELKGLQRREDQRVTDLAKAGKIKGVDPGAVDRILAKKAVKAAAAKPTAQKEELTDNQKALQKKSLEKAQDFKRIADAQKAYAANLRKRGREEEAKAADEVVAHHTRLMNDALNAAKNPAKDAKMKIDMNTPEGRWFARRKGF